MRFTKKNINLFLILLVITIAVQGLTLFQRTENRATVATNAARSEKLTWAPPALENPTTQTLGTGYTALTLDTTKDYIIQLPSSKVNGNIRIDGGRNIVIKGGHVSVPKDATSVQQHAFRLAGQTGTVHIEGVLIDGSNGGEEDCFYLDTPDAIIQIQNVRCMDIPGTTDTNHSDIIQFHAGHKEVRVDRLTGSSYYQGFFIGEHDGVGKFGPITLKNVNVQGLGPSHQTMLWMASSNHDYLMGYTITLQNVWLKPGPSTNATYAGIPGLAMPNANAASPYTMTITNNTQLSWPGIPEKVNGFVHVGAPATDFVPEGTAGLQYVSPGYEGDTTQFSDAPTDAPTVTVEPTEALISPTYFCAGNESCITDEPTATIYLYPTDVPVSVTTQPEIEEPEPTQIIENQPTIEVPSNKNPKNGDGLPNENGRSNNIFTFFVDLFRQIIELLMRLFQR